MISVAISQVTVLAIGPFLMIVVAIFVVIFLVTYAVASLVTFLVNFVLSFEMIYPQDSLRKFPVFYAVRDSVVNFQKLSLRSSAMIVLVNSGVNPQVNFDLNSRALPSFLVLLVY
jgi:hypothetical protein